MRFSKIISVITLIIINHCSDSKTISYGIRSFPASLDPTFGLSFDESQISSQIYENLVTLDEDCKTIIPNLAKNWFISDDHFVYTFTLHDNIFFHDNTRLSSYSVLKTFKWLRKFENRSEIYDRIKKINIIDSLTFQFVLNEPFSIFLYVLASPESFQVMSEKALQKYGEKIGQHPVGTGPYMLDEWIDNDKIILKKFTKYPDKIVEVDKILFKFYKNRIESEKDLAKHKIDILYMPTAYSIDRLKWTGHIDYHTFVPVGLVFLGFNNKSNIFKNKDVRKAVLKAIDIPRFVYSSNRGKAIVAKGPLPPNYYEYKKRSQAKFNLDSAKQILKKHNFKPVKVYFDFTESAFARNTSIEFLRHELEKIGIFMNPRPHKTWKEFYGAVRSDDSQIFINIGRSDIIGDGLNFLYGFFYSTSEFNILRYNEPEVDNWIEQAILEHDPQKRKILYDNIVNKILEDTPAIFLFHNIPNLAYNNEKIKHLVTNPYGTIQFNKVKLN